MGIPGELLSSIVSLHLYAKIITVQYADPPSTAARLRRGGQVQAVCSPYSVQSHAKRTYVRHFASIPVRFQHDNCTHQRRCSPVHPRLLRRRIPKSRPCRYSCSPPPPPPTPANDPPSSPFPPLCPADILEPVRGVIFLFRGRHQLAAARAECKHTACSGMRLQEDQGPCPSLAISM
jgi:hypothetical protein